ncbi:hypothetical protein Tco_0652600 [Tanacetum coccineum]|uniref:Uncharacterized protein n=1 Tax=Tanacetum coccineum TaxID=301880 RepID=A0ABQ4WY40_9ASTR
MIPDPLCMTDKGVKNDIEPIASTMTVNRLVLEYEERIKLPGKGDEVQPMEEQKLYLMRRSLEVLRKFHWMILRGQFNQLSHVSSPLLSKPGEY